VPQPSGIAIQSKHHRHYGSMSNLSLSFVYGQTLDILTSGQNLFSGKHLQKTSIIFSCNNVYY